MIDSLRAELGEGAFSTAWSRGTTMTVAQAIDFALGTIQTANAEIPPAEKDKFGGLTAREREVAALIAQGKSNKEIAEAMTVGVKTVETYVTRVLGKLGFDSRVQVATWAIEQGLLKKEER